jgi:hypothetical protein
MDKRAKRRSFFGHIFANHHNEADKRYKGTVFLLETSF